MEPITGSSSSVSSLDALKNITIEKKRRQKRLLSIRSKGVNNSERKLVQGARVSLNSEDQRQRYRILPHVDSLDINLRQYWTLDTFVSSDTRRAIFTPEQFTIDTKDCLPSPVDVTRTPTCTPPSVEVVLPISVSFSNVTIREFRSIPGDNPGVSGKGPPLTLAWDPIEEERYDIDSYEKMRTIHYPRRRRVQILSPLMRESRLLKSGNKWSDIRASTRAANKLRKQRNSSLRSSNRKGTIFGLFKPGS